jgi:hypothetical protein
MTEPRSVYVVQAMWQDGTTVQSSLCVTEDADRAIVEHRRMLNDFPNASVSITKVKVAGSDE